MLVRLRCKVKLSAPDMLRSAAGAGWSSALGATGETAGFHRNTRWCDRGMAARCTRAEAGAAGGRLYWNRVDSISWSTWRPPRRSGWRSRITHSCLPTRWSS